jgi:hypothetical protein
MLLQDVRFAARVLIRNPMVTTISVLALGLGIGATTAVFSVVDATLLTPPPFHEPDRLVRLFTSKPTAGWSRMTTSLPDYHDWGVGDLLVRAAQRLRGRPSGTAARRARLCRRVAGDGRAAHPRPRP